MNKKKSIAIVVFLLAICLIVLGIAISFLSGGSPTDGKLDGNNKKDEKIELLENEKSDYKQDVRMTVIYFDSFLSDKYPINDVDKLSAEEKTLFLIQINVDLKYSEIPVSKLKEIKNDYFKDFDLYLNDIKDGNKVLYKYDSAGNKFIYNDSNSSMCFYESKEISAKEYVDSWEVVNKIYFSNEVPKDGVAWNYIYNNAKDCENNTNLIHNYVYENGGLTDEEFKKIEDKLDTYVYTFERVGKKYLMKSIVEK